MARTVDHPMQVPVPQAGPLEFIVADDGHGGGYAPILAALNGLYEQLRTGPVADGADADGAMLDATTDILRYRCRTQGRGALADDQVIVALRLEAVDGGDSDPTAAEVRVIFDGGTFAAWNYSVDLATPTMVALSPVNVPDTNDYYDLTVQIIDEGADTLVDVLVWGVNVFYARAKTALNAGVYANDFVPCEASRGAAQAPMSAGRHHDLHADAIALFEQRVGQIVARAWAGSAGSGGYQPGSDGPIYCLQDRPITRGSALSAVFYVYAHANAVGSASININGQNVATTPGATAWYSFTVPVTKTDELGRPALQQFKLSTSGTGTVTVYSWCGWWDDVEY